MTITEITSLALSVIALAVSLLSYFRDKSDLRFRDISFQSGKTTRGAIIVVVSNFGRRPVQVRRLLLFGGKKKRARWPVEKVILQETDEKEYIIEVVSLFLLESDIRSFRGIGVQDTYGKTHRYPSWSPVSVFRFIRLKRRILESWRKAENLASTLATTKQAGAANEDDLP